MTYSRVSPVTAALIVALVSLPCMASAQTVDDEIAELRAQLLALSARLDELESQNQTLRETNSELQAAAQDQQPTAPAVAEAEATLARAEAHAQASSWTERLKWSGDFRYRFENIAVEDREDRNRSRIRARAALTADIYPDLNVGIGIASGSEDPVSSNQTLGKGGSSKDLTLDLAYFSWSGLQDTRVLGGKFKDPLAPVGKNSMLWDSDWRPEGLAIVWDNGSFFANGIGTWLESDSNAGNSFAWIAEAGFRLPLGEDGHIRAGLGGHAFDVKGRGSFFEDGDFFGNSFLTLIPGDESSTVYRFDYEGVQAFAEVAWSLFDRPAMAYADYVRNTAVDEFDTGFIVGLQYGSAREARTWDFGIAYEDIEADAALGLLVDSDFGGGGTDARGWILDGTYAIRRNLNTRFTYFINEIDGNLGTERDFNRLMLDLNFKF